MVVRLTCRGPRRPGRARISRSTVHRATGVAFAVGLQPDLSRSVDAEVRCMYPPDLVAQLCVSDLPGSLGLPTVFVVGRRGDLHSQHLGQGGADRLDTPPQPVTLTPVGVLVDELRDQREGRSSSAAKKADAAFRMALARLRSAFSRFNRRTSKDSSVAVPGRSPPSTCPCRTQLRTVSGVPTPSSSATRVTAAHSDSCSPRISATIHTARSRNSGGTASLNLPA